MIEKPKRKKQLNNQDRQIPANIQELINRYDLDNKDIYDYLDKMVTEIINSNSNFTDEITNLNNNVAELNKQLKTIEEKTITLYENSSGSKDTNITLSDSASNYSYIEVFYYRSTGGTETYASQKIAIPNGKVISLNINIADSIYWYFYVARYTFNENILTFLNGGHIQSKMIDNSVFESDSDSQIYIYKVIGYR